jgi:galactose mutarotase-like enzyme
VLTETAKSVLLASKGGKKGIRVTYPDMDYIGFWHKPKTDAPYVCIEPWSSLPSRKGIVEDLATKPDLIHLQVGTEYENQYVIEVV